MSRALIYSNDAKTVILLDVPASLECGQQVPYVLKSSIALENPYPSTEPKGPKRDAAIEAIPINERTYHTSVQQDISSGLVQIRNYVYGQSGAWCHARRALISQTDSIRPSRIELKDSLRPVSIDASSTVVPVILSNTELRNKFPSSQSLQGTIVCNPRAEASVVEVKELGDFIVPPGSTFILGTLQQELPAFLALSHVSVIPKTFDLILMDPPWSNRSVRNASAYRTSEGQVEDPFQQAVHVMKDRLAPQGLVAIWITNKASIRSHVLHTLQALGLFLLEEWVWIKITARGLPVSQLDGVWRRPYEMLLLFRKGQSLKDSQRRVLAAVPDLHSRKPCLKFLLEDLLPTKYNAMELFARSLTAGWWSWGDEVLKFQHESQWASR